MYSQTPINRLFIGAIIPEAGDDLGGCGARHLQGSGEQRRTVVVFGARSGGGSVGREVGAAVAGHHDHGDLRRVRNAHRSGGADGIRRFYRGGVYAPRLLLKRDFRVVFVECATIVGGILLILGVALGFTNYLIDAEVPPRLIARLRAHVESKYVFLLLIKFAFLWWAR